MLELQHLMLMLQQKKYVDENSGGGTSSNLTIDSNIDMNVRYRILNLPTPSDGDEPVTKQYDDIHFFPEMEVIQRLEMWI